MDPTHRLQFLGPPDGIAAAMPALARALSGATAITLLAPWRCAFASRSRAVPMQGPEVFQMIRPVLALLLLAGPALADAPVVEAARATAPGGTWRFDVTLSHPDTGWDHYADGWRIEAPDGTELGFRELLHPHVNEQPFTRSLSGVTIPAALAQVLIRPRCNVDGWSDQTFPLDLSR